MARKKVKMVYIESESARKLTYKKRKKGICKKADELSTLCDVPVCVVINSEYDSHPEFWPSREAANEVVSEWRMLPAMDKTKKMVNQETFLEQRIAKATESWRKLWKENKELEMTNLMFDCLSGKTSVSHIEKSDLRDFGYVIEQHLKDVNRTIEIRKQNGESSSSFVSAAAVTTSYVMPMVERGSSSTSYVMPMAERGSSSIGFNDQIPDQIVNRLTMKQTKKDLDLNKKL